MSYINPKIESSYYQNDIGKTLYEWVLENKPKTIIEFGCLYGYSTVAIGLALKELGQGKLKCYDLWENYKYKHSTIQQTIKNVKEYGVEDYVEFIQMNYYDWLSQPEEFDMMHLDISNTGDIILQTYDVLKDKIKQGSIILFEGGSEERDNVEWMVKYNASPINSVKSQTKYKVVNPNFPSLSVIKNEY
jgi:predicted O-methyltransferase YrrM